MTDTCTQAEPSKAMTTVLPATTPPKRPTKKAQLIKLLSCKLGTDVATISAKFGWQPHTTRAALSGLRKVGFEITKENADATSLCGTGSSEHMLSHQHWAGAMLSEPQISRPELLAQWDVAFRLAPPPYLSVPL